MAKIISDYFDQCTDEEQDFIIFKGLSPKDLIGGQEISPENKRP